VAPEAFGRIAAKLAATNWAPPRAGLGATLLEMERIRRGTPDAQRQAHFQLTVADFIKIYSSADSCQRQYSDARRWSWHASLHEDPPRPVFFITYGDLCDDRRTLAFAGELFYLLCGPAPLTDLSRLSATL
jgi:hypothetical protein